MDSKLYAISRASLDHIDMVLPQVTPGLLPGIPYAVA